MCEADTHSPICKDLGPPLTDTFSKDSAPKEIFHLRWHFHDLRIQYHQESPLRRTFTTNQETITRRGISPFRRNFHDYTLPVVPSPPVVGSPVSIDVSAPTLAVAGIPGLQTSTTAITKDNSSSLSTNPTAEAVQYPQPSLPH